MIVPSWEFEFILSTPYALINSNNSLKYQNGYMTLLHVTFISSPAFDGRNLKQKH